MTSDSTTYYGKKYRRVFITRSRKKANIIAHSILLILKDNMDVKEKVLVMVEHDGNKHRVFVKCPFDKFVKKI